MTLNKYKEKRNFKKTAEPKAGKSKDKEKLIFVIQKHAASHLHYDFRLEMEGVLKSWAVPKGPSIDPSVKRLAMMVEEHPFDYRNFEGIIPKGEYGGGTVIVWDEGYYEPIEEFETKKQQETHLLKQLKDGSLKIHLQGKKLKGEFALVKTHGMGENAWLLIKHKDDHSSKKDILKDEKSVQSGKTLDEVTKTSNNIYGSKSTEEKLDKELKKKPEFSKTKKKNSDNANELLSKVESTKIPTGIKPMLATLVDEPFDDPNWIYEIKWDGYRVLGFVNQGTVQLLSRNNKSFNEKYYPITQLLENWKINALIDGEIVVLNDKGISNFGALQNWRSEVDGELVLYVFDLLWYEGKNLMALPLVERQEILKEILPTNDDRIRLSEVFDSNGIDFLDAASKLGLEGIMAKKSNSVYTPSNRSKDWLKIKVQKRQEVVIGGFTKNNGTSKLFSSLLLGVYEENKFKYVGKVGTGFSDKLQSEMMTLFQPLIIKKTPFSVEPNVNTPSRFRPNPPNAKATWLKPELVAEVSFTEITNDGVFRHPSFKGMRMDKKAKEVTHEREIHTTEIVKQTESENGKKNRIKESEIGTKVKSASLQKSDLIRAPKSTRVKTLLNPKEETQVKKICGHDLKFTNLSKVYWPEDGITKRDMFNYYYQVAEYILPYLKDRAQSLNRFPNGIHKPSFYQKDIKGKAPDWVKTYPYTTSDNKEKEYLVGTDEASLLWMASLGCIEMNPWFSKINTPDNPDYCVIDLDPSEKNSFDQVIQAAIVVKEVLDEIKIVSYCKTSGSTGIHIYIPLNANYNYDQSQLFAKLIVSIVQERIPEFTSLERMVKSRKGKMYLDFLQNRPGATIACPYSLRPKPGATVSMPLDWDEVKPGLKIQDFNIHNIVPRLKETGDLFKGALGKGVNLEKIIEKAESLLNHS